MSAAEPEIQRVIPVGIPPGQAIEFTVLGSGLTPATRLWTSCQLDSRPAAEKPPGHFTVTAPEGIPLGIHALRVVSEEGVSQQRLFVIDDLPAAVAAADNREPKTAQIVKLPAAIDGAIGKLERHFFRFAADQGERLSFEVLARRLGSALDPALFVYHEDGRELAYSDDVEGLSGDCQLVHTFTEPGTYVLELRDIQYEGGDAHFYRLRIGDFPCLNAPYPFAVQRGQTTRIDFVGQSAADADPAYIDVPDDWPHHWYPVSTRRSGGTAHGFTQVAVSSRAEFLEQEPNNTPAQANRITLETSLNGRFQEPGDTDRFQFAAKKGQRILFRGITRQRGAATDLVMSLYDHQGKQLVRKDDDGTSEGVIDQTFSADGEYTLLIEDLHRRGGAPYAYRVEVEPYSKGLSLTASADRVNVPAAGVGLLHLDVVRTGHNEAVSIAATSLPEGWRSLPCLAGPGVSTAVLAILGPEIEPVPPRVVDLEIVGTSKVGEEIVRASPDVTSVLAAQFNNLLSVPLNVRSSLAAAVSPSRPYSVGFEPSEVTVGRHLKTTLRVVCERGEAITETITITAEPEKNALPPEATLTLKPIAEGSNEVAAELSCGEKTPLGSFSVVLKATHKKDKSTDVVISTPLVFHVEPAFGVQVDAGDRNLPRGGEQKLTVTLTRNPAFSGDVIVAFEKLPAGTSVEPATIPSGQNRVEVVLKASPEATQGEHRDIAVKVTATENDKLSTISGIGLLTIP